MTSKQWKILLNIILVIAIFLGGFFTAKTTIKVNEVIKTEYIKGDTITNVIYEPVPTYVKTPVDTLNIIKKCIEDGIYAELWPSKTITKYVEVTKEDTTVIMKDWATKRIYDECLFKNDSIGYCSIKTEVQYNRMKLLSYDYVPIIKQITETQYKVKLFSPYVGIGYMTNPWDEERNPALSVNGGLFIKEKYGIQVQLVHMFKSKNDYVGGSFIYKF